MIIIGTDEAGYGPNLGPLVVSLTAWKAGSEDISCLCDPLINKGIRIADSKKIYHNGTLAALETGVLVPLHTLQKKTQPIVCNEMHITELAIIFEEVLQQYQVQLLNMQYRSLEPAEFNLLLDRYESKGTLLSNVTLGLIVDQIAKIKQSEYDTPVLVLCDKHGGRNHYLDLLVEYFPDEFIRTIQESRKISTYQLTPQGQPIEFRFLAKGESYVPIALASMFAKYHRELAMIRFNDFWQSHVPGIQPTAGYPADAKRFKNNITIAQQRLGIAEDSVWRKR